MSTDVRIALVYQQAGGSEALRTALANAGVIVAAESRAETLDAATLLAADVDAVVVNLDPELEDLLDEVMERLDGLSQPVIYNDPEASSDLSGWDRARWLRHLSAKVKGGGSLVPPPPPGAEAIPAPAARVVEPARPAAAGVLAEPPSGATEPAAVQQSADAVDIDMLFVSAGVSESSPAIAEDSPEQAQGAMVDLDALFDSPSASAGSEAAAEAPAPAASGDADFDALFVAPADSGTMDSSKLALADLDALFAEEASPPAPAVEQAPPARNAAEVDSEIDLSALLADFSLDQIPSGGIAAEASPPLAAGRPVDDGDADRIAAAMEQAAAPVSRPAVDELVSDLADLDALFADPAEDSQLSAPLPESDAAIGIETLELGMVELELEPIETDTALSPGSPAPATPVEEPIAVADFDFGFELEPMSGESAPVAAETALIDPLDALFAPTSGAAGSSAEISLPDLDRVFVLGGSIGGPEAMKAFLARLPAQVPAAFIIAQHMGAEFLQMMASQLDAATALAVRFPKSGERLRHGEAVVAPSDQRLAIDSSGHVQLQPNTGDSPYSPSIDQLVSDAIERFGDRATLILFSGMGSDALEGARQLIARGGQVWVQERSSCVVASMIDGVKAQGLVRFEGSPVELADRVLEVLS